MDLDVGYLGAKPFPYWGMVFELLKEPGISFAGSADKVGIAEIEADDSTKDECHGLSILP